MILIKKNQRGFSLIEILIVIGIVGILVTLSATSIMGIQGRARDGRRKIDIAEMQVALTQYYANQSGGFYPVSINTLVSENYIDALPLDPSTNTSTPYMYATVPTPCDNSTTFCTSYTISIELESEYSIYTVNPNSSNTVPFTPTP